MSIISLENIKTTINADKIIKRMGIKEEEDHMLVRELCAQAQEKSIPKAVLDIRYIDDITDPCVTIGDTQFCSSLLANNLAETSKVILYVVTCGREVYDWACGIDGFLEPYIAEQIKIEALGCAYEAFNEYIKKNIFPEKSSIMNPGSLKDWPLLEQKKLFSLIGCVAEKTGVLLNDSCLMIPDKSVSGIVFTKEKSFVNCMLCDREKCSGRRAGYEGGQE